MRRRVQLAVAVAEISMEDIVAVVYLVPRLQQQ